MDTSNIANRKGMVEANISEATAPDQLRAAQGKLKNTIGEQQIKEIANEAWKDVTSLDPAVQAQGYKMLTNLEMFVKMRQEHQNKLDEDVPKRASQEKIAAGNNATQLAIANMRKRDAAGRATIAGPIEQQIANAKTLVHKGNIYEAGAAQAMAANPPDLELAQYYMEKARESYQLDTNNRAAGVNAGAANKPNLNKVGIATNDAPTPSYAFPGATGSWWHYDRPVWKCTAAKETPKRLLRKLHGHRRRTQGWLLSSRDQSRACKTH